MKKPKPHMPCALLKKKYFFKKSLKQIVKTQTQNKVAVI